MAEVITTQSTVRIARQIIAEIFGPPTMRAFAVRFWDGTCDLPTNGVPRCTFVLRGPQTLRRLLLPPSEHAFASAYLRDDLDIQGGMESAVAIASNSFERLRSPRTLT